MEFSFEKENQAEQMEFQRTRFAGSSQFSIQYYEAGC